MSPHAQGRCWTPCRHSWLFLSPWPCSQDVSGADESEDEGDTSGKEGGLGVKFLLWFTEPWTRSLARAAAGPTHTGKMLPLPLLALGLDITHGPNGPKSPCVTRVTLPRLLPHISGLVPITLP